MIRSVKGFISSLAHRELTLPGSHFIDFEMVGKWINLLGDVKPSLSQVALMFNPDTSAYFDDFLRSFKACRSNQPRSRYKQSTFGVPPRLSRRSPRLGRDPGCGLIAGSDIFIVGVRKAIVKSAEEHRVPVISPIDNSSLMGV